MSIFKQIRMVVKQIPKGKVTTYGTVAKYLGTSDARLVGWAMYGNRNPSIPCHRVVKKNGEVAEKYSIKGWREQKRRLLKEGIKFIDQTHVDLEKHFWQPSRSKFFLSSAKD
jgi:methylated-DNA-protein-cysteine methyltransferase-like protein